MKTAHCAADCHETFTTVSNFDRHRHGDKCLPPESVGLVLNKNNYWSQPSTGDNRFAKDDENDDE